jgi:hypothetical protein
MQCLLERHDAVFLFRVAYDQRYARYAPGVLVHMGAMEHFHAQTSADYLDSCASPSNRFIADLLPDRRRMSTIIVVLGGPLDRALVRALPYTRGLASRAVTLRDWARQPRHAIPAVRATARRRIRRRSL